MFENTKPTPIVTSCTLADLLESSVRELPGTNIKGQLTIPEYQRPYVWGEKQINSLLDDWLEYDALETEKPLYYLGSIILHHDTQSRQLNIIDGQQRITTALLLQKFKEDKIATNITHHNSISIDNIKNNLSYLKAISNRLIFDYSEQDVIQSISFDSINVTLVITTSEDLAYTFFETQNTGGVRLSGSDILKAHHLRAIPSAKIVNYQARKWEFSDKDFSQVEYIIQQLTKIRFWDNRRWQRFPFYRNHKDIKQSITDEFTLKTKADGKDISYHYSSVVNNNGRLAQMHESTYKMLKQPLSDGNNTLDYINDYIELYNILFQSESHHLVDDRFYTFRKNLINGANGTIFLKELFEVSIMSYVSRFGFHLLYEASLWLFRAIYSLRVSNARNVREDSVFKFVFDQQFIDNILEVFTTEELFLYLKKMRYNFDTANIVKVGDEMNTLNTAKTRFIRDVKKYFGNVENPQYYHANSIEYDIHLKSVISNKINSNEQ